MNNYQQGHAQSQAIFSELARFVGPLLVALDRQLDKRLVNTFLLTLQAIITFRHRSHGLLLSELGGYILAPWQAPAGTKRLSNLLRSQKWHYRLIGNYLWHQAGQRVKVLHEQGQLALAVWDESVIEKPESLAAEGLCAVRSSRAARLKRIKPGYYNPPGGRPIHVPGLHWMSVLVLGMEGSPTVALMRWWTTRGKFATQKRPLSTTMLRRCARTWGRQVIHVWDRGFASGPWLGTALRAQVRFIVRWKKAQKLVDAKGKRNAWKITRGKRSLDHRLIWDARRHCWRQTGIIFAPVTHPDYPDIPLFLVVSRPGQGRSPWYLLTNEPIQTAADAWTIVLAYARRWQVELTYRYAKTELAMESPRLWRWSTRLKLMMMVTLVYAFLLSLLTLLPPAVVQAILQRWCPRTGKRHRLVAMPLYRLRSALSRLWLVHPPRLAWLNSG